MRRVVSEVFLNPAIQRAFQEIAACEAAIEADQIRLTCIPAPPFAESERAAAFSEELRRLGFSPISDAIGNVIAPYSAFGPNPVVIAAHLDTVFPASTPLAVRRKGRVISLPGISDNGAGVVAVLWMLRIARSVGLRFHRPVIAIGNVGEEGEGNLRGIRHLFQAPPWENRACDFIAVDGGGFHRITQQALGSRRFRIRMNGPGGHSWADFGRPNPIHAMAAAVHEFTSPAKGKRPGIAFNVGVLHGGLSVNAIPSEAVAEVDLRSITAADLDEMEARLRAAVTEAGNAASVRVRMETMGERPSGRTSPEQPLVQVAQEATRWFGVEPHLDVGSTDANIPMSMGLPAISIGGGGVFGNVHTTEEWFDPSLRHLGIKRLLGMVAVLAELCS